MQTLLARKLASVALVNDVLAFMKEENERDASPLKDRLDPTRVGLLGHSFGGSVGLAAIQDICVPFLCNSLFDHPAQLKAGIFYGTNFTESGNWRISAD